MVLIELDGRLTESPGRKTTLGWPEPIHKRLDDLVRAANEEGARTTRQELAAALILACTPDPQALVEMLEQYRTATVSDPGLGNHEG